MCSDKQLLCHRFMQQTAYYATISADNLKTIVWYYYRRQIG